MVHHLFRLTTQSLLNHYSIMTQSLVSDYSSQQGQVCAVLRSSLYEVIFCVVKRKLQQPTVFRSPLICNCKLHRE